MPVVEDIQQWSVTAALNGTADPGINWAENMPRADVNNSARSMMATLAKDRNLRNGSITTAGTAAAQTFSSGHGYTTVPTGLRVLLRMGFTNPAGVTLNMDGIGPVAIRDLSGNVLPAGVLRGGGYAEFRFDGTSWSFLGLSSMPGVSDGSNAAAGFVGEVLTATATDVLCNIGGITAVVQLTLTSGDWDVAGGAFCHNGNPNKPFYVSITDAPAGTDNTPGALMSSYTDFSGNVALVAGPVRRSTAASLNVYAVVYNPNTDAAILANGKLFARRAR